MNGKTRDLILSLFKRIDDMELHIETIRGDIVAHGARLADLGNYDVEVFPDCVGDTVEDSTEGVEEEITTGTPIVDPMSYADDVKGAILEHQIETGTYRPKAPESLDGIIVVLDNLLGDTDPDIPEDWTDEDIKNEEPLFWACRELMTRNQRAKAPESKIPPTMIETIDAYREQISRLKAENESYKKRLETRLVEITDTEALVTSLQHDLSAARGKIERVLKTVGNQRAYWGYSGNVLASKIREDLKG